MSQSTDLQADEERLIEAILGALPPEGTDDQKRRAAAVLIGAAFSLTEQVVACGHEFCAYREVTTTLREAIQRAAIVRRAPNRVNVPHGRPTPC